jgi:hypothetical protein
MIREALLNFLHKISFHTLSECSKLFSAPIAVFSAFFAWKKERKVTEKEKKLSEEIRKDQFNRRMEKVGEDLEKVLEQAIQLWCSNLEVSQRLILEVNITSTSQKMCLDVTWIRKNFPDLMGDSEELLRELIALKNEISGGDFQSKKFKNDLNKAKLIASETHGIRKILREKIKP